MTKLKDLISQYGEREVDLSKFEDILLPDEPKTIWELKYGDTYYSIRSYGSYAFDCTWDNGEVDFCSREIGDVFLTEEETNAEIKYRKVKTLLQKYASECKEPIDWNNDDQLKHLLCYYHPQNELTITSACRLIENAIYFTDKSILEKAIEEIGEQRIIEDYFGVK